MAEAVHIQSHKRGAMPFLVALRKLEQLACRGSTKELSDALTFFHQAGHSKVTLINHRIRDHNGRTLVHLAAQNGNHDCLDVLLQAGGMSILNGPQAEERGGVATPLFQVFTLWPIQQN